MLARESKSAAGSKKSRTADFVRMWRRPQDGEGATVSKDSQRLPWSQGRLGLQRMYSIEPQVDARHSPAGAPSSNASTPAPVRARGIIAECFGERPELLRERGG